MTHAFQENQADVALQQLKQIPVEDIPQCAKFLIPQLQAILQGDRSTSLADDPNLDYRGSAELQLLLEQNWLPAITPEGALFAIVRSQRRKDKEVLYVACFAPLREILRLTIRRGKFLSATLATEVPYG